MAEDGFVPPIPSTSTPENWWTSTVLPSTILPESFKGLTLGALGPHPLRVAAYAYVTAQAAGIDDELSLRLRIGAAFHDIGKTLIPRNLLLKPGSLSREERHTIETHTVKGGKLLFSSKDITLQEAGLVALLHHENFDGSGYPNGLSGDTIPLAARITRVADVYDALTMSRPYARTLDDVEALELIWSKRETLFDPAVVHAFMKALATYPGLNARLRRFTGERMDAGVSAPSIHTTFDYGDSEDEQ